MGNISSRPDEGGTVFVRDQSRLSIASLVITSPQRGATVQITPNAFPATRFTASRPLGESSPVEYIQDPDYPLAPSFLLKLSNEEDLIFTFTFVMRQTPSAATPSTATSTTTAPSPADANGPAALADTNISGLTYVYASTAREVENLVTREFHADPNLHKNANVELVGDYSTGGSPSVTFHWTWKWRPPKAVEDRGGGWRNSCSFVEYDSRAHMLHTLASFSFWVSNTNPYFSHPSSPVPPFQLSAAPPKIRVASTQSVDARLNSAVEEEPSSPRILVESASTAAVASQPPSTATSSMAPPSEPVKVDISCPRPGDDVAVADDGPVFRATIKVLEQKTGNMRTQMKKIIKKAEHAHLAQMEANDAFSAFIDALRETSSTNANAVQPAIDHYFDKIAREILSYERQNSLNLQRIVIDPLNRLYTWDIKQAEAKKRDFEEESKDYYSYVGRYLGQRHDSVKAKKLAESDTKYQTKRRNFELKRFDYSSFMQDLSGGRKEQEVLSHLTRYADAQAKTFLGTAQKVDGLLPQLEALSSEVQLADKEYQYQRREREEKRRLLEKSTAYVEPDSSTLPSAGNGSSSNGVGIVGAGGSGGTGSGTAYSSDTELGRADSTGSQLRTGSTPSTMANAADLSRSPGSSSASQHLAVGSPQQNSKFKGIRDLEERDPIHAAMLEKNSNPRKEGLLWALNRPGGHVDPRAALNKQGWHKFWIVLDQGKLSEYSNWKQKLDLHMDPIDLRMASVREARNAERRFCFEVITPQFKRVYQATSEEDMNSWITSINNALQSAVEGGMRDRRSMSISPAPGSAAFPGRDIGSILTGKSSSLSHGHRGAGSITQALPGSASGIPTRRITVGARPSTQRSSGSFEEKPDKLLQMLRENDQGNCWCADCGSGAKVEWVSINLAIILCIECSGIHRSLGTHISKVRSLTLDITSFTPDIVELLLLVGNRVANMVWEARLEQATKPTAQANREQRLRFITSKYVDRAFIEPISSTLSRYSTSEETLLAAIKRNEIQQVIYALALKASPNATDKSRGTHAVFLALAAADPASPSGTPPSLASAPPEIRVVPFPVAELLVQNGAEIPTTPPAIPLSRSAQLYLEAKRGRTAGLSLHTANISAAPVDSVGASPSVMSSPGAAAMDRLAREREARLQKRVSAGGRLAKSPIPER